jgi:release factor glutamine methyltransferase
VTDANLRAAVAAAAARLTTAGVPSPRHDAEVLAAHMLGVDRKELVQHDTIDELAYGTLVDRRAAREPLQHLTGKAAFRRIEVAVGPGVFIPRPETEATADAAIEYAKQLDQAVVADLYAGSGVIALSILDEVPEATVHAVEAHDSAFGWLKHNTAGTSVVIHHADVAACLPELSGYVDVVVANPPYIPIGAHIRDPEVALHDPAPALWSGSDGLDAMRVLEATAARLLQPGGLLVAEHSDLQEVLAPTVFVETVRWFDIADHHDLAGRPRYLTARRAHEAGRQLGFRP